MGKSENSKKVILGLLIIAISVGIFIIANKNKFGNYNFDYQVQVTNYNNLYEGNNIKFYYMDGENDYQQSLKSDYKINEVVKKAGNDIEKAFALIDWINEKAQFNISAMETGTNTKEILEKLTTTKSLSDDGYATILEETLSTVGTYVRKGALSTSNNVKPDPSQTYKVVEVWSKVHGKWVMIDGGNKCYMTLNDMPLSAVEVIQNGIENVNIVGLNSEKDMKSYKKNMSKYFNSYTIAVDNNSKFRPAKSNSFVTFVKNVEDIQLENQNGFVSPTIFVNKPDLFILNPEIKSGNRKKDDIPTVVVSKKDKKEDVDGAVKFTVGAFKDSVMMKKYYISLNGGSYTLVNDYYDLSVLEGDTKIELSVDGKTPIREITFKRK